MIVLFTCGAFFEKSWGSIVTYKPPRTGRGKKHIQDAFLFEKIPDLWHHGGICGTVKLSNQPAQKIEW